jgi:uncharacterized protein
MESTQSSPDDDMLHQSQNAAGPLGQSERIESLDVLRGVAVLGILVINVQSFAMIPPAFFNPTTHGDISGANFAIWLLGHTLVERKFMTIFSMLFGAGVLLMASRREAASERAAGVHYRRMSWLLLLGLLHGHLLWYGDILYSYAMCGFLVYLFRRARPVTLIILGLIGVAIPSALYGFFAWSMPNWGPKSTDVLMQAWAPSDELIAETIAAYRGGWMDQMRLRMKGALVVETLGFLFESLWRTGGLMLVGMALLKLRILTAERSSATYIAMIAVAVVVGVPITLYGMHRNFAIQWDAKYALFYGIQFNYWASILVSLGWIGGVMLICKSGKARKIKRVLAAAGQMALTNYLGQTVICTTIFYGHGFGLFEQVDRTGQFTIVLGVWAGQLIISPVWLRRFRFGPVEWAWRSLTYWKIQPMRRA